MKDFSFKLIDKLISDDKHVPTIRLRVENKIPTLDSYEHTRAYLKYLLENNKVTGVSLLCGKCRYSLLNGEKQCPQCNSFVDTESKWAYSIMVANAFQNININILSTDTDIVNIIQNILSE